MPRHEGYLMLKEDFRSQFRWDTPGLTRDGFREWARKQRVPPVHVGRHKWKPMKDGTPVRRSVIEAFSEFISDELKLGRFPVSEIAAAGEPELGEPGKGTKAEKDAMMLGWSGLFARMTERLLQPDDAFCMDEADIAEAAKIVVHWVGTRVDNSAYGDRAMALGQELMKRTWQEYAHTLLEGWKANEASVLFHTERQKDGSLKRVGVSVVLPLTEAFYQRFRRGEAEDGDIGPQDLLSHSQYLLMDAVADTGYRDDPRALGRRSMLQASTVVYQMACVTKPMDLDKMNLHLISIAPHKDGRERLHAYSFMEVGTKTRVTNVDVMEFGPPKRKFLKDKYPRALAQYLVMKASVLIYQSAIRAERRNLEE